MFLPLWDTILPDAFNRFAGVLILDWAGQNNFTGTFRFPYNLTDPRERNVIGSI